jgi:hypothetical protein
MGGAAVLIGATMNETDLPLFKTMLAGNNMMRVFPRSATVAPGKTALVLPDWEDSRLTYCKDVGAIPFVSTKVDGDPDAIAYVRKQLLAMPDWVTQLYITDRHEPEGDLPPETFKTNFTLFLAMIDALPPALHARIRCGPVLTKTWTEPAGAGRSYDTYDPGTGAFFAVDMYVQSGTAKTVVNPSTLPTPAQFTAGFVAYRKDDSDHRDRLWAEWGVVGMPGDVDGTARAAFIRGVYGLAKTWDPAVTGWKFIGMIWWNSIGKATGQVAVIGQRRDFPLHLRTVSAAVTGFSALTAPSAVPLPGSPPAPVAAYNALFTAENPPPEPVPAPPADVPARTYDDGWREGRAQLLKEITALVQSATTP